MKKIVITLMILTSFCRMAHADTIIIVDENNVVKQQIYTGASIATPPAQPQQVVVTQPAPQPQVVVVRETITPRSYYYDSTATSILAGFTGAVIGTTLFRGRHHHGGWRPHPMPPHHRR